MDREASLAAATRAMNCGQPRSLQKVRKVSDFALAADEVRRLDGQVGLAQLERCNGRKFVYQAL